MTETKDGSQMRQYSTIVVGTDGSDLAGPTVGRAAWLAAHEEADLVIVCAWTDQPRRADAKNVATLGGDPKVGQVPGRAAASEAIASAVALAQEAGATIAAALLVDAEPSRALLDTARERSADLVVVGAVRDVSIADRLLGTVATEVLRRARCDVLVVRPPRPDPAS